MSATNNMMKHVQKLMGDDKIGGAGTLFQEPDNLLSKPETVHILKDVKQVQIGYSDILILTKTGLVYGLGPNTFGAFGFLVNTDNKNWILLPIPEKMKKISMAASTALFIGESGQVYASGSNIFGATGIGKIHTEDHKINCYPVITKILHGEKAKEIFTSSCSSYVLTEKNKLYTFGANFIGQLGIANKKIVYEPTLVPFDYCSSIKKIQHGLVLLTNGDIYVFGKSKSMGCKNEGIHKLNYPFIQFFDYRYDSQLFIGTQGLCAHLHTDNIETYIFLNHSIPVLNNQLPEQTPIKDIQSSSNEFFLLYENGNLYFLGSNEKSKKFNIHNANNEWKLYESNVKQIQVGESNILVWFY